MGGKNSTDKHSSSGGAGLGRKQGSKRESHQQQSVSGKNSERMKDDYVKFIMREQLRREKEFKNRANDKDNIYSQVAQEIKKESKK